MCALKYVLRDLDHILHDLDHVSHDLDHVSHDLDHMSHDLDLPLSYHRSVQGVINGQHSGPSSLRFAQLLAPPPPPPPTWAPTCTCMIQTSSPMERWWWRFASRPGGWRPTLPPPHVLSHIACSIGPSVCVCMCVWSECVCVCVHVCWSLSPPPHSAPIFPLPVLSIKTCACGLALHYLSCEEAVASFKTKDQALPPGSLRQVFVDKLYKMDEVYLQSKAPTVWAWTLPSPQSQPYALAGGLKYASLYTCTRVCDVCDVCVSVSKQFVVLQ